MCKFREYFQEPSTMPLRGGAAREAVKQGKHNVYEGVFVNEAEKIQAQSNGVSPCD
jgi:hypothetical protein